MCGSSPTHFRPAISLLWLAPLPLATLWCKTRSAKPKFSCLQTTCASSMLQPLPHSIYHWPSARISTRPWWPTWPPAKRTVTLFPNRSYQQNHHQLVFHTIGHLLWISSLQTERPAKMASSFSAFVLAQSAAAAAARVESDKSLPLPHSHHNRGSSTLQIGNFELQSHFQRKTDCPSRSVLRRQKQTKKIGEKFKQNSSRRQWTALETCVCCFVVLLWFSQILFFLFEIFFYNEVV